MAIALDVPETLPEKSNVNKKQITRGDQLCKDACKAFGISDEYLRLYRYYSYGEIVKRSAKLNENGRQEIEITEYHGEMITVCTVGGERARLMWLQSGKIITECRGIINECTSLKDVEKLEMIRITGNLPKRKKKSNVF